MDLFSAPIPRVLRPHQAVAIDRLRERLIQGNTRVVLQAPTGFGKTVIAAHILETALAKGKRAMFVVPRLTLVDQAVTSFLEQGLNHIGVIQGDHSRSDLTAPVQVASVQTLARKKVPGDFGLVLVDECHEQFAVIPKLMGLWPSTRFIGLSATPWAKGMGRDWQALVIAGTTADLIRDGLLSPFTVFAPDVPDLTGVAKVRGAFVEDGLARVMGDAKLMGSVVCTWLEKAGNRPTFAFAVNCAHARALQEDFLRAGVARPTWMLGQTRSSVP